jgi:hypothetical protein
MEYKKLIGIVVNYILFKKIDNYKGKIKQFKENFNEKI